MHIQPSHTRLRVERFMMIEEKEGKRPRDIVDRFSELPECILHNILSILDTKGACRVSVLSKTWYRAWSSIPVLDFQFQHFKEHEHVSCQYDDDDDFYDIYTVERYVGFIRKTMQRYFRHKYRITKLCLELPEVDDKLKPDVDQWIRTAVQNQIQELDIKILLYNTQEYKLPEILFCAKSLKVLKCDKVVLPYYETMELISLEYLKIILGTVDEDVLQRIVSFSPLVEFEIMSDGPKNISLPWKRKVNEGSECFGRGTRQSNLKASPLTKFVSKECFGNFPWQWNLNVDALENLRKLEIVGASITDDIVSVLACGLVALESLLLVSCSLLKCIKISSISLKDIRIARSGLITTIDAPNLLEFWYDCEEKEETSVSLIRAHDHCNTHFDPLVESITVVWFVKLKKFLMKTSFFKSLVLDLSHPIEVVEEMDQLRDVVTGPPFKLRELKLLNTSKWNFIQSSLVAFLDGLFWSCHPDVISITARSDLWMAKLILGIVKRKMQCRKHPLKSIEVEGVDYSSLLSESSELEFRFRLSWLSV